MAFASKHSTTSDLILRSDALLADKMWFNSLHLRIWIHFDNSFTDFRNLKDSSK